MLQHATGHHTDRSLFHKRFKDFPQCHRHPCPSFTGSLLLARGTKLPKNSCTLGGLTYRGAIATGKVYEQRIELVNAQGDTLPLRRISVALHEPTREGDTEIHLLSNVPGRHASAQTLAASYGKRWTI